MGLYSVGVRSTDVTINQAVCEIFTNANVVCKIMEIGICQVAAAAVSYGIGRPAAQGVTPGTLSYFQAEQTTTDPTSKTQIALSWATSPTAPTVYMRRVNTTIASAGAVITFPKGLLMPINSSVVIFNITAGSAADIWVVIDE
jgi:hypothetical protein